MVLVPTSTTYLPAMRGQQGGQFVIGHPRRGKAGSRATSPAPSPACADTKHIKDNVGVSVGL